jgi:hypothetical protein
MAALSEVEQRFCLYLAAGDSIAQAGRRVGIGRTTAYRWQAEEDVKLAVAELTLESATRAKRQLASMVTRASRTVGRLMQPGAAAHKGAPTELEAAKLVIQAAQLDSLPVLAGDRRIMTYVPRPGRDDAPQVPDTSEEEASLGAPASVALPLVSTADGLPPDLPRALGEQRTRKAGYAQPQPDAVQEPVQLMDPEFWRGGGRR